MKYNFLAISALVASTNAINTKTEEHKDALEGCDLWTK